MLRSAFFIFMLGWATWFWIDKPPPDQQRLPPLSDSLVENFQTAFDILKTGYPKVAFVYIWEAHYLLLALLGGVLVSVLYGAIADHLGRRRMRRQFMPPLRDRQAPGRGKEETVQPRAAEDE